MSMFSHLIKCMEFYFKVGDLPIDATERVKYVYDCLKVSLVMVAENSPHHPHIERSTISPLQMEVVLTLPCCMV